MRAQLVLIALAIWRVTVYTWRATVRAFRRSWKRRVVFNRSLYTKAMVVRLRGKRVRVRSSSLRGLRFSVAGAHASLGGGHGGQETSVGRMLAGGILLGPLGVLGGALLKRDASTATVLINFADGRAVVVPVYVRDTGSALRFIGKINAASAHYSQV